MGEIINKMGSVYTYINNELSDERTRDLPLISAPLIIFGIISVYLTFCLSIGPRLMKNREAFKLKKVIMWYNIVQILLSLFLTYEGLLYLLSKDYNFVCDPLSNNDARSYKAARTGWWYFFAKNTELLETVFFVLRKKDRQVSTLHLYHHTMVVFSAWLATKYFPMGHIILVGCLNSFVHILMYTYYFLAGLGPKYQKYLWWKKHMTLVQLVQFVIVITHNTSALFLDCNYPKIIHLFIIANTAMLFYMFSNFYYHNYIKVKPKKKTEVVNGKTKLNEVQRTKRKSISVGR